MNRSNQQKSSDISPTYDENLGSPYDQLTEDNGSLVSGTKSQGTTVSRKKNNSQLNEKQPSKINEEDDEDDHDVDFGEEEKDGVV